MLRRHVFALICAAALATGCLSPNAVQQQVPRTETFRQLDTQLQAELAADSAQLEQMQNLVKLTLPNGVLFAQGSRDLDEAAKPLLASAAPALKPLSNQRIVVKGFTDDVPLGDDLRQRLSGNVELSKARADAVVTFLSSQGVPADAMTAVGLGEASPVASNASEAGRAKNRRVEIDIVDTTGR